MNNIIFELLRENKKALQGLHAVQHFDFEKDFYISKKIGGFTLNQVKKEIESNISGEYRAAILVKREVIRGTVSYPDRRRYFVDISKHGFDVEMRAPYQYDLDQFWGKGVFEETRKRETKHFYIIAQKTEFLSQPTPAKFDLLQRFDVIDTRPAMSHGVHYLSGVTIQDKQYGYIHKEYKPDYDLNRGRVEYKTTTDIIDKSGYIVSYRRHDLKRRAAALRAQREKEAAAAADYIRENKALLEQIEMTRDSIAIHLKLATDESTIKKIADASDVLRWLYFYYERHTEKLENKLFSSIAAIEKSFDDLNNRILKIYNILEVK